MHSSSMNRLKFGVLSFVYGGGVLILYKLGIHDLTSPWLCLALLPLIAIYIGELTGWISWFRGISLPSLSLFSSANFLVWLLNTQSNVPSWIGYLILGLFFIALVFALLRIWTYRDGPRKVS